MLKIGIVASGRGSNAQAILDACRDGRIDGRVVVVAANKPEAGVLERARRAGVEAVSLPSAGVEREAYHEHLAALLEAHEVDMVCHAGYMLIAPPSYIDRFRNRILNIHPSLLPAFPGLHAQRQALEHGVKVAGCTVHIADETLDGGPIVMQAAVPVLEGDTEESLAGRILVEEHRLYPAAIQLFAEDRVRIEGRRVLIDGPND